MIFYTLEKMGIPYVVVKYRLTCPSFDEDILSISDYGRLRYTAIAFGI